MLPALPLGIQPHGEHPPERIFPRRGDAERNLYNELKGYVYDHRDYCTGFFFGSPRDDAQIYYKGGYIRSWEVAAIALKSENGTLTVSQRNRFFEGDELEIMNRGKAPTVVTVKNLKNALGESVDNAPNPMAYFTFDCDAEIPAGAFIRRSTDGK